MNEKLTIIENMAGNFGLELDEVQLKKFEEFEKFLREYNSHTNLVSSNDVELLYEKHLSDSLAFGQFLNQEEKYKIIDIGSGGGFPVIPMAIVLDKSKIIAVDSTKKKVDFLNSAATTLKLKNFTAMHTRAEELAYRKSFREKFDIATARAVGNLAQISELCLPFLKIEGKFLSYKAMKVNEEIEEAQNAIEILGGKVISVFDYELKLEENFKRNIIEIEKISSTPNQYPRSFSAIKSKPL